MKAGACGIAGEVCGYFVKGICDGCVDGNDEGASKEAGNAEGKVGV